MKERGFSLIELLVGIAIIITATTVVLSIIVSSFRISSKSTSNSVVRQNGNYALSQMTRILQFADSFEGGYDNSGNFHPICDPSPDTSYVKINVNHNGSPKSLNCSTTGQGDVGVEGESSIDTSKMKVSNCSFTCTQENGSVGPVIGISFDLSLGDENTVVEKTSKSHFSTTVKMRNP